MRCDICGSGNNKFFGRARLFKIPFGSKNLEIPREADYYQCKDCGIIFQYPLPTEQIINAIYNNKEYYSFNAKDLLGFYNQNKNYSGQYGARLKFVNQILNFKKSRILEVGSGHSVLVKLAT